MYVHPVIIIFTVALAALLVIWLMVELTLRKSGGIMVDREESMPERKIQKRKVKVEIDPLEEAEWRAKANFAHGAAGGFAAGLVVSFIIFIVMYVL